MMQLDLQKSSQKLQLDLNKSGVTQVPSIDVAFALDVSGSFDWAHKNGTTTQLLQRLIPWAMVFDPNKSMEAYTFSTSTCKMPEINMNNFSTFIKDNVLHARNYNGGTDYSPVIHDIRDDFGWTPQQPAATGGFFQNLFGKKPVQPQVSGRPTLVFFVTDGENSDQQETLDAFTQMQENNEQIFVIFMCMGDPRSFSFLARLASNFQNTDMHSIADMSQFVNMDDEHINQMMITSRLTNWLK